MKALRTILLSSTRGLLAKRWVLAATACLVLACSLPLQSRAQTVGNPLPAGVGATAMAMNPGTHKIYVADQVVANGTPGNTVTIIDTAE